ncbi:MAG: zinc-binding dehydrogenase [Acidimicrobiia bacterium]|nr:zinc-binding dehydrogenase [Acidimicrobiia bacterium]MBT8248845.1 zinc-binding dehydrogenase [Acidimicrobiia bacterium]NND12514.1 zinc-binding dehydrogenase [Acidimicrobiia bacterium]NNL27019.1 zinc-binding dehydrogenase [Acidimicrobiia bacterium]
MRAVQFVAPNEAMVTDVDQPSIGPDDVLIASRAVGICHSDFELLSGQYIIPFAYPVTPGHEWCGEVVEVGKAVAGLVPGDRVVGECVVGPGGRDHFGFNIDGAAAELFRARGEWLHKIPDELTDTHGALVEPFSVAYNAVRHLDRVDPSDHVAVLGGGPIGLMSVMAVAACNAKVTLVEPEARRRQLGLEAGASNAIDPTDDSFADAVGELTMGRGFEGVIEAAGSPAAMSQAIDLAGHGGRIAYVGINIGSSPPAPMGLIQSKALSLRGLIGSMNVWPESIRFLASGVVDPSTLVTASFGLEQALDAYEAAQDTANNIKVHIRTGS